MVGPNGGTEMVGPKRWDRNGGTKMQAIAQELRPRFRLRDRNAETELYFVLPFLAGKIIKCFAHELRQRFRL